MRQKSVPVNEPATQVLKNVRRATRFSLEHHEDHRHRRDWDGRQRGRVVCDHDGH